MKASRKFVWSASAIFLVLGLSPGMGEGGTSIAVTIRDHKFSPSEIHVKANAPSEIALTNADPTAEEFDSSELKVEKVVAGGEKGIVRLRPLSPGRYRFMGEYHSGSAQGVVIAE
jgi:hypothetical protein